MTTGSGGSGDSPEQEEVVSLGREPPSPAASAPPRRLGTLHGLATTGMAVFAFLAITCVFALVTVRWAGSVMRYLIAALVMSVVGAMACASAAVLSAARDTYARDGRASGDASDD
jgi:hypothetical protein